MLEEVEYGSKLKHRIDMVIIMIVYLILMFGVPFILDYYNIAAINDRNFRIIGDATKAFWIYVASEFLLAVLVGIFTRKSHVYRAMIIGSPIIKFVCYIFITVFLFFFKQIILPDYTVLLTRIILAYNAYHGLFLLSIIIPTPTLLGLEIGRLIKNKYREFKIKRRIYGSKNKEA